jgi:hypothetical protein
MQEEVKVKVPNTDEDFGQDFNIFIISKQKLNAIVLEYSSTNFLTDYVTLQNTNVITTEEWDLMDGTEDTWILRRYISTNLMDSPFHKFMFLVEGNTMSTKIQLEVNKTNLYEVMIPEF